MSIIAFIRYTNKKRDNYIFNDISENVTLVQLMDTAGNVNHTVSITGRWIYDSNFQKRTSFDERIIGYYFSPYKYEKGTYAEFEDVLYAVRYVNPEAN